MKQLPILIVSVLLLALLIAGCQSDSCHLLLDAEYKGKTYGGTSHQFVDTTSSNPFSPSNAGEFDFEEGKIYRLCLDKSLDIKEVY